MALIIISVKWHAAGLLAQEAGHMEALSVLGFLEEEEEVCVWGGGYGGYGG